MRNRFWVLLAALFALNASAQDVAVVNARTIKVKLDNPHARVMEATLQPGDKEGMHSHPATILYIIQGGKVRNHFPDGSTNEVEMKTGDVVYREPLTHWAENIGSTTVRIIVVELKPNAQP